jgi:hypothetical protein
MMKAREVNGTKTSITNDETFDWILNNVMLVLRQESVSEPEVMQCHHLCSLNALLLNSLTFSQWRWKTQDELVFFHLLQWHKFILNCFIQKSHLIETKDHSFYDGWTLQLDVHYKRYFIQNFYVCNQCLFEISFTQLQMDQVVDSMWFLQSYFAF